MRLKKIYKKIYKNIYKKIYTYCRLSNYLNLIKTWVLPHFCVICHQPCKKNRDLCTSCAIKLPWTSEINCQQCAIDLPYHHTGQRVRCGACIQSPPAFDQVIAAFNYIEPIRSLIIKFKSKRQLNHGRIFSELLSELIQQKVTDGELVMPDLLIPVPLHWWRHSLRGYNQSNIIAKYLSKLLALPSNNKLIKRTKYTKAQKKLSSTARAMNLIKAFKLTHHAMSNHKTNNKIMGKSIAIIDDVLTSGNTANALAKLLKQYGATNIQIWVIARANYH